ncbi:mechanosensitive ion channel family protein [Actinospica durhamensis]|uniref:Mechanosensitive ion channel family protein n=1 Tax=Actinospica durhamensis TaxID=1508375 RepID=A0A941EU14_9ACTN|nr:mechanosensitive ion channel family protein [Actinospica durhamensis]MBR7836448.1 mechanosensitive ion channel family protein [Actinospica durhamensis]
MPRTPEPKDPTQHEEPGAEPGARAEEPAEAVEAAEHWSFAAINQAISADFRRAIGAGVLALLGLALTYVCGGVLASGTAPVAYFTEHRGLASVCSVIGALFFFGFGVVAVRSATKEVLKTVPSSVGDDRKVGLRWICLVAGYLLVIFGTLGALNVPIERLAVGAGITGVILGIAAQQAFGNFFAGLVLLIVRPVSVGQRISVRSGPIGGPYSGEVVDMTLTYVRLATDRGTLLLPNSTVLSAVVGPIGVFEDPDASAPLPAPNAPPTTTSSTEPGEPPQAPRHVG